MNRCILVFGMPRSGTTWIGKLFDSHPDTLYRHEPDSVRPLSLPLYPETRVAPQYREELEQFVASLPGLRSSKVVGKRPLFRKSYQSNVALCAYRLSVTVAKATSRVRSDFPCLYRPTAVGSERARLVWKSIESPGRLGVCVEALPHARAIHLMRHPCGYVASVLRGEASKRFDGLKPSADDLWLLKMLLATSVGRTKRLSLEDVERLTPEERLTWRWVLTQEKILADTARCERVLTLRYEDVCAEPLAMTRRMFEFTGIDWQSQTERFIGASTQAANTDYYSVFKNSKASADRWSSELAPPVIDRILRILHDNPVGRFYNDDLHVPTVLSDLMT
ncbi:sulfotransferase family protein [Rhodanobacter terrae]|uniref:Sulfotransferase family protein n=1 Tax=Rhodanobacter terrae TaxID=418647 RepID=A0ABW0SYJ1_9GAMM